MKKITKVILLIGSAVLFLAVAFFVLLKTPVALVVKNELSLSQADQIYISASDKKAIKNNIKKDEVVAQFALRQHFESNDNCRFNSLVQIGDIIYIDVTHCVSNNPIHVIWKCGLEGNIYKYVQIDETIFINSNNSNIHKKAIPEREMIEGTELDEYVDPFKTYRGFTEHYRKKGLEKEIILDKPDQTIILSVYETMDQPKVISVMCEKISNGLDISVLAMVYKTTVSDIVLWLPEKVYDENGILNQEILLCTEKLFAFRYGRQVEVENNQECTTVIDEWSCGKSFLALNNSNVINQGEDCFSYEIVDRPWAMSLCDEYFAEKGADIYFQNKT